MFRNLLTVMFCLLLGISAAYAEDGASKAPVIDEGCTPQKPVKTQTGACFACSSLKIRNNYAKYLAQCPQYKNKYVSPNSQKISIPEAAKKKNGQNGDTDTTQTSSQDSSKKNKAGKTGNAAPQVNNCPLDKPAIDAEGNCHACNEHIVRRHAKRYSAVCSNGKVVDFNAQNNAKK